MKNHKRRLNLFVKFLFLTVLLESLSVFAYAQPGCGEQALVLSTRIMDRKYPAADRVELKLQLRFTNTGRHPRILYRPALLLYKTAVFEDVEPSNRDAFAEVAGISVVPHPYSSIPSEEMRKTRPTSDLIVIPPRGTHEMEQLITVRIRSRIRKQSNGANDDRYQLTVKVSTWNASEQKLAAELCRKWRRLGVLWSETIESDPMSFTVERTPVN